MTRINVVPVADMWYGHRVAEYEELPRVFLLVRREQGQGTLPHLYRGPSAYVLGPGHLRFFYTRLGYLRERYATLGLALGRETALPAWTSDLLPGWYGAYEPTPEAVLANKNRINTRLVEMGLTGHLLSI